MSSRNDGKDGRLGEVFISDEQMEELVVIAKEAAQGGMPAQARNTATAGADPSATKIHPPQTAAEANAMVAELFRLAGIDTPPAPIVEPAPRPSASAARLAELSARAHARADNGRDGYTKTAERTPIPIPLSAITQTRVPNIRVQEDEAGFASMCESLSREGQLQDVIVVADVHREENYELVTGHRRLRAAAALGWPTIRAMVLPAGTPDEELLFINAAENAQRHELTTFEVASRAQFMRDRYHTSLAEYARRLGVSDSRIQNLVRYLERLPADVIAAWRAGDRLLNDHMLGRLAGMPPEAASMFWASWKARQVASLNRPPGKQNPARRSQNRPTASMLARLWITARRSQHLDEKTRDLIVAVIDYCSGFATSVPGLFDPKQPCATPKRRKPGSRARASEEAEPELQLSGLALPSLSDGMVPLPSPPDDEPEDD